MKFEYYLFELKTFANNRTQDILKQWTQNSRHSQNIAIAMLWPEKSFNMCNIRILHAACVS